MADNVLGLFFEITADPSKAVHALSLFRSASEREAGAVTSHLQAMQEAAERARRTHETAFGQMTNAVQGHGEASLRVFAQIAEGILRNIDLEQLEVVHKTKAEASKILISKQAIKELAAVKAVEAFAKGLEALGDFNFFSAAKYFAAATLYGSLAALQISTALGAGGGGAREPRGARESGAGAAEVGAGPGVPLAAGFAGSLARPSGNVTVMVMGEPQAATWLTKVINQGVLQQDLMLVSSHTRRSAPAGR